MLTKTNKHHLLAQTRVPGSEKGIVKSYMKSNREEQVPYIPVSDRKRLHNRIDPSLQGVPGMAEYKLGRTICRRHHPQPSSSSWTQSWQKWHLRQVAGRQMVRTMLNEDNIELAFSKRSKLASRKLVRPDSRRQAQRCHHQPVSV